MIKYFILFLFISGYNYAQNASIKIIDETNKNRLYVFALNESEMDYDVKITITGTNIRQSTTKPRFIHVPAATKVLLKSLIIERKKIPSYTYDLVVNDSLSRRALKPTATPIKIQPKKQIVVYTVDACTTCDSIISGLNNSKYKFTKINMTDNPDVKTRMNTYLDNRIQSLDSLENPIINLGGILHIKIDSYDKLMETLNKTP